MKDRVVFALVGLQIIGIVLTVGMWIGGINAMEAEVRKDIVSLEKEVLVWLSDAEKQRREFIEMQATQQDQINEILQYLTQKDPLFAPRTLRY